jgi:hypothetical protein
LPLPLAPLSLTGYYGRVQRSTDTQIFLERCLHYVGAAEVRLEISSLSQPDANSVALPMGDQWRLIARFEVLPDDVGAVIQKLQLFAESFRALGDRVVEAAPKFDLGATNDLDATLEILRARTGALRAIVIDGDSPVLWGSSDATHDRNEIALGARLADVDRRVQRHGLDLATLLSSTPSVAHAAIAAAGLEAPTEAALVRDTDDVRVERNDADREHWQRLILTGRAVAPLREDGQSGTSGLRAEHGDGFGYMTRLIGGIYWLVLVFDGPFSELHAMATLQRAAPVIEAMVAALPPVDPEGGGGKVIALPRRS